MKKAIAAAITGVTALCIIGGWLTLSVVRELEAGLHAEKQRSASLANDLELRTQALNQKRLELDNARSLAERAFRDVEEQSAAAQSAKDDLREAEQARIHAEQVNEEALLRETRVRQELAELRERRQKELDRMQQALSKIAPTRRTASGMVIELANDSFYFDFDKATLRPENRELLSRIAGVLLASEGYRLFVWGHTDDIGPSNYNQELSFRRASSVADYLQQAGVPDDVMKVQGFGKSSPRVANDTPQARQRNRRVEIGIVDSIVEYKDIAPEA